jgi:hypothetical protein
LLQGLLAKSDLSKEVVLNEFDDATQAVIRRLKNVLGINASDDHELVLFPSPSSHLYLLINECLQVLFPSGSDAEFLPLVCGLIRSHSLTLSKGGPPAAMKVFNFVLAAGEVGSGTPNGTAECIVILSLP